MRKPSHHLLSMNNIRHARLASAALFWLLAGSSSTVFAQNPPAGNLAQEYGFLPVEIYKFDNRMSNLTLADLDGDRGSTCFTATRKSSLTPKKPNAE